MSGPISASFLPINSNRHGPTDASHHGWHQVIVLIHALLSNLALGTETQVSEDELEDLQEGLDGLKKEYELVRDAHHGPSNQGDRNLRLHELDKELTVFIIVSGCVSCPRLPRLGLLTADASRFLRSSRAFCAPQKLDRLPLLAVPAATIWATHEAQIQRDMARVRAHFPGRGASAPELAIVHRTEGYIQYRSADTSSALNLSGLLELEGRFGTYAVSASHLVHFAR